MTDRRGQIAAQFDEGLRHHRSGRLLEAERLYRQVCTADPGHAGGFHLLGVVSHQLGRGDAADSLRRAVALKPDAAPMHNDLGAVLAAHGNFADAAAAFARAVALAPDYAEARNNLAMAHFNLGLAARAQGQIDSAVSHLKQAVALAPKVAEPHHALAAVLQEQGKVEQALAHCRAAAALQPNSAGAHNNLGNALREIGQLPEAVQHYQRALALQPGFAAAHYNLGVALRGLSRFDDAAVHFAKALAVDPDFLPARFALCMAQLPILYGDTDEIERRRAAYHDCLAALRTAVEAAPAPGRLAAVVGAHQPFYLAYQGRNDRDLQASYGSLVCRIMGARYPTATQTGPPSPSEKIRVAIVSGFFRRHSNWKIPIKGWLSELDRRRFRVFGYHTVAERDAETGVAAALCERFVQGPLPLDGWREAILADAPHVIIYPEVGMDPVTAQLAAQRLAPVQCGSWGHPDTTGFPTLDHYLSSALMEPPDGEEHYTERLVRLPGLSIYYEPPDAPARSAERATLGLRPGAAVFWCSQSLPKYLPQFDPVFARIARDAGDCQFTFISFPGSAEVTERFRARLERTFAALGLRAEEHCVFLPRLDPDAFVSAIGACDAMLDSIGWSGCNSILESLAHDLPIVTLAGTLMRGRHAAAILRMMDVPETITETVDAYVDTAVRLARDAPWRTALKDRIARNKHRLYRDHSCIAALETFLEVEVRRGARA